MTPAHAPLPGFPPGRSEAAVRTVLPGACGIRLRPAVQDDLAFMRQLYGLLRADELDQVPWPDAFKQTFLDSQFALQHRHFVTYYADADFYVVECDDMAIGRYYLLRESSCFLVVDIALLPPWRGRGIGSALLEWTKTLTREHDASGIELHVDVHNVGARRLYARAGFVETVQGDPYIAMRWPGAAKDQLKIA
jgi:GNAT superfamily N-acetyltransferase